MKKGEFPAPLNGGEHTDRRRQRAEAVEKLAAQRLQEALEENRDVAAKNFAIPWGVAFDKVSTLSGQPTSIIAGLDVPGGQERLAAIMQQLERVEGKPWTSWTPLALRAVEEAPPVPPVTSRRTTPRRTKNA